MLLGNTTTLGVLLGNTTTLGVLIDNTNTLGVLLGNTTILGVLLGNTTRDTCTMTHVPCYIATCTKLYYNYPARSPRKVISDHSEHEGVRKEGVRASHVQI